MTVVRTIDGDVPLTRERRPTGGEAGRHIGVYRDLTTRESRRSIARIVEQNRGASLSPRVESGYLAVALQYSCGATPWLSNPCDADPELALVLGLVEMTLGLCY